jgi:cobalt transporter subunit CbtB
MDAQTRQTSAQTAQSIATPRAQAVAAGAVALLLGSFLIYGVGFAQPQTIHNAAHDSRHSFTFPCH